MDVLGDDHDLQAVLGRNDFDGIENDAIDFGELEKYINDENASAYFDDTLVEGGRAHAPALPVPQDDVSHQPQQDPKHPSTFGVYVIPSHSLPESPPDSGSEPPYSPQDHGGQSPHQRLGAPRQHALQDILIQPMFPVGVQPPLLSVQDLPAQPLPPGPTHTLQLQSSGGETILVQHPVVLSGMPPTVASPLPLQPTSLDGQGVAFAGLTATSAAPAPLAPSPVAKKRKLSQDGRTHVKTEPGMAELSPDSSSNQTGVLDDDFGLDCSGDMYLDSSLQCIRFSPFQPTDWHVLCDQKFIELQPPKYQVVADKGFNFSNADDAFVCQKKNHFQITCHIKLLGDAQFVKTPEGFKKILSWQLHFYGVKTEATAQTIKVEQSQSDRSKKAFHPVQVELRVDEPVKKTVGRLHFSETTSNNMRKKGKPNPDQRYFYLVVGLHAHCSDDLDYAIVSHNSERIIVRASNPGQFESDAELCWQKGTVSDSIYHTGRCGINTDRPEEALTVHGNLRITGHVIQPSDSRAKEAIKECDTREQLRNVAQIRVVHYRFTDEFARHAGLPAATSTGVIAQEVQNILPEAVSTAGDVVLPNGTKLDNFLVVNRDRLFMENVGAVKELCKVTDNLETRIDELERMNKRLTNLKRLERMDSLKSVSSNVALRHSRSSSSKTGSFASFTDGSLCSNKIIQITIVILVLIMAFCLVAMATLYFLEFQKRSDNYDIPLRPTVIHTQTLPPLETTSRPSKLRYKSGATPYSKKLTTVAPISKPYKGDRDDHKEREKMFAAAGAALPASLPPPSSPPARPHPVLGRPLQCGPADGDGGLSCATFCCRPESPPSAAAAPESNAAPTVSVPPPDLSKAPSPPGFLNSNALSSRLQRAADEQNNLEEEAAEHDKQGPVPGLVVRLLNLNRTLGPDMCDPASPELAACRTQTATNYSYLVHLSRHLPDKELRLHISFWPQRPVLCASGVDELCWAKPGWTKDAGAQGAGEVASSAGGAGLGPGPADGAAKQHLTRTGGPAGGPESARDGGGSERSSGLEHTVAVDRYHSTTLVFRVPWSLTSEDVCKKPVESLGRDFVEYRIHFSRRCNE